MLKGNNKIIIIAAISTAAVVGVVALAYFAFSQGWLGAPVSNIAYPRIEDAALKALSEELLLNDALASGLPGKRAIKREAMNAILALDLETVAQVSTDQKPGAAAPTEISGEAFLKELKDKPQVAIHLRYIWNHFKSLLYGTEKEIWIDRVYELLPIALETGDIKTVNGNDGKVDILEFIKLMSTKYMSRVRRTHALMDVRKQGVITVDEVKSKFDISNMAEIIKNSKPGAVTEENYNDILRGAKERLSEKKQNLEDRQAMLVAIEDSSVDAQRLETLKYNLKQLENELADAQSDLAEAEKSFVQTVTDTMTSGEFIKFVADRIKELSTDHLLPELRDALDKATYGEAIVKNAMLATIHIMAELYKMHCTGTGKNVAPRKKDLAKFVRIKFAGDKEEDPVTFAEFDKNRDAILAQMQL